eukprot:1150556-Pelagomonas_calceolata.AAC.2
MSAHELACAGNARLHVTSVAARVWLLQWLQARDGSTLQQSNAHSAYWLSTGSWLAYGRPSFWHQIACGAVLPVWQNIAAPCSCRGSSGGAYMASVCPLHAMPTGHAGGCLWWVTEACNQKTRTHARRHAIKKRARARAPLAAPVCPLHAVPAGHAGAILVGYGPLAASPPHPANAAADTGCMNTPFAGATAVLAACRDLLLLVCMPLTAAHCGMAFLLRLQLHYVKSMWGMMRGNVRKPRQMQVREVSFWLHSAAQCKVHVKDDAGECA